MLTSPISFLFSVTLTARKLEEDLLTAGHCVCIVTTSSGDAANTDLVRPHPNRRVVFLDNSMPIPFLGDTYQLGFSLSPSVKRQLEDFEPTLIHLTCPDCTALHLIQYARVKEIPIMGTYHSNIPEYMEHYPGLSWLKHILAAFFRHQYNFLQALYVPTAFIQHSLATNYKMDCVTDLQVWGHGVDTQKFHPRHRSLQFRRDLGIGDGEVVVCWCSRLVPEKRPDVFANIVRRLHAQRLPFHALVIGDGPCQGLITSLPNTTFLGWMSQDQLSQAYASSDIFLFPSAVETFGLVTLEAAASGLPVIVEADCSGHLVSDGETGFSCPQDDEEAFYEATVQLVVDEDKRRRFGSASRALALHWDRQTINRRMLENYSSVTQDFYTEYGGRHVNRDAVYDTPYSFLGGNLPRPLLLVMVEYIFLSVFQLWWTMTTLLVNLQSLVASRFTRKQSDNGKQPAKFAVKSIFKAVELDLESSDDETSTTLSSSNDAEATVTYLTKSPSSASSAFGDSNISHRLAKAFIRAVQLQCRFESYLRSQCRSSIMTRVKRKNSNVYDVPLPRSVVVPVGRGSSEGHRLRRNCSHVDV
jgi:phosphatidylinositol alpha 1,6-mannosyltransferase